VTFSYELAIIALCGMVMAVRKNRVRSLHDRLKLIHEVEKNPGEKRVNIAKDSGCRLAHKTLYSPRRMLSTNKYRYAVLFARNEKITSSRHLLNWKLGTSISQMLTKWQTMVLMMIISAKIGKNCVEPRNTISRTVSVDRDVATSGVSTVEELCEAYGSTRSVEEKNKEDENEEDMVPSFAETYETLEKLEHFSMRTVSLTRTMNAFWALKSHIFN
jgi:hypothetical protein